MDLPLSNTASEGDDDSQADREPSPLLRAAAERAADRVAERHAEKVERVARELRDHSAHASGRPVSFKKRAVSHQVPKRDDRRRSDEKIDLTDLDEILAIDPEKRICIAEPGVTFEALVAATLPLGLVPIVVPELKTITIGGAVSGCSLESMSFRYGGFHDTCLEYEILGADGTRFIATPDNERQLLFQMMHGSFGTLGVLTKLTFTLVPAKRFVHVVYEEHRTLEEYRAAILRRASEQDVDFIDGIIHAKDKWILSVGRFVDEAPYASRYDWMKIYWQSTGQRREDYLRTPDYFFRYDRGVTNVHPKSFAGRLLFGKVASSARLLRAAEKLHRFLPADRPKVTVDLFLPLSRVGAFFEWYDGAIGFYPLWCVPYRRARDYEWVARDYFADTDDTMFVDLAIYGLDQPPGRNVYKEIEDALPRLNGIKTLISYNYYEERDFWRIWNRPNYEAVKALVDPDNVFRDLYSKTCRASRGLPG